MKKWSLLSVPLLGLAGLAVWAQALAGAPADHTGVVIQEPVDQALIPTSTGARSSDASSSLATAKPTAPVLKAAPLNPASTASAPDERTSEASQQVEPATPRATETADDQGYDGGDPGVQHVQPTQITSPAVAPDATSHVELDDNGGLDKSDNSGSGGSNDD